MPARSSIAAITILALLLASTPTHASALRRTGLSIRGQKRNTKQGKEDETQKQLNEACDVSDDEACGEDAFCLLEDGKCNALNGNGSLFGTCRQINHKCTRELRWVCGCNDVTYPNRCVALSNGVSIKRQGRCS